MPLEDMIIVQARVYIMSFEDMIIVQGYTLCHLKI